MSDNLDPATSPDRGGSLPKWNPVSRAIKRAFDIGFILLVLPLCLPVAVVAAVVIRLTSPGSIIYVTERAGLHGKLYRMYKFRTMVQNAIEVGPSLTHQGDARITGVGRMLRRTKFDEFPQVINVLKGDMSIVGPRPPLPQHATTLSAEQAVVLETRPGMTSLAQVAYRDEEDLLPSENTEEYYLNVILPRKNRLDLAYVRNWSLTLDAKVFLVGLAALFRLHTKLGLDGHVRSGPDSQEKA